MKKVSLWGVGALLALGFVAYLLAGQASWAGVSGGNGADREPFGPRKGVGFDPSKVGAPGDSMPDILPDRPGADINRDRSPDDTVDRVFDESSDCKGNFSGSGGDRRNACDSDDDSGDRSPEDQYGDGNANGGGGIPDATTDNTPDYRTFPRDGVPDATRFINLDRALEGGNDANHPFQWTRDYTPDWIYSDTYLAKTGGKLSIGDLTPDSHNNSGDPLGSDVRAHDGIGDSLTSGPDSLRYASGPGDEKTDEAPDIGGLGTSSGGGGGGGCSMVAGTSASPASGVASLLVLFAPVAALVLRRRLGRR